MDKGNSLPIVYINLDKVLYRSGCLNAAHSKYAKKIIAATVAMIHGKSCIDYLIAC